MYSMYPTVCDIIVTDNIVVGFIQGNTAATIRANGIVFDNKVVTKIYPDANIHIITYRTI